MLGGRAHKISALTDWQHLATRDEGGSAGISVWKPACGHLCSTVSLAEGQSLAPIGEGSSDEIAPEPAGQSDLEAAAYDHCFNALV